MTLGQLLKKGTASLKECGVDNAENEALWLLESATGLSHSGLLLSFDRDCGDICPEYEKLIEKRKSGIPVQYITGTWPFYGIEYSVGEGVLIPRPETEMLVDCALERLKGKKAPVVIDFCAGTGCVGLTVAKLIPDSWVFLIEKYDKPFEYLEKNRARLQLGNVFTVKGDIFDRKLTFPKADLILSNPPYIRSSECGSLQREVLREPAEALDGGEDGLEFYYAIAERAMKSGSDAVAVECGEDQAESIAKIFAAYGKAHAVKDFANIERMVVIERTISDVT